MTLRPDVADELGHENLMEFCRESARWSGTAGAVREEHGVMLFATATAFPVLTNGVFRTGDVDPGDVVATADRYFGSLGRGYTVYAREHADADLVAVADAAGLVAVSTAPAMLRREPVAAPTVDATLRWVDDDDGVADFVTVGTAAYSTLGMPSEVFRDVVRDPRRFRAPHVDSVVAYDDRGPVAAAQVLASHGIAGVYWVGTVERARRRGLGEAVTAAVTNRALDRGAAAVVLQASTMGEPIYARMGYDTRYRYVELVRFEPAATS